MVTISFAGNKNRNILFQTKVGGNIRQGFDANTIAAKIVNEMHGWQFNTEGKERVYAELMYLTDDELKTVYNLYNRKYSEGKTLTSLLDGEYAVNSAFKKDVVSRLRALNLP